eukprot:9060181-Alexandrium_andersonii.AAC.1
MHDVGVLIHFVAASPRVQTCVPFAMIVVRTSSGQLMGSWPPLMPPRPQSICFCPQHGREQRPGAHGDHEAVREAP